jgi:hypothetical protein
MLMHEDPNNYTHSVSSLHRIKKRERMISLLLGTGNLSHITTQTNPTVHSRQNSTFILDLHTNSHSSDYYH